MSRNWTPKKSTVELDPAKRPSRIRRDPVPVAESAEEKKELWFRSNEWEIKLALIGIIVFALIIDVFAIAISEYTAH